MLLTQIQNGGVAHVGKMLLPKHGPQQVSYATKNYGRKDLEQGMDQRRNNIVRRGRVR